MSSQLSHKLPLWEFVLFILILLYYLNPLSVGVLSYTYALGISYVYLITRILWGSSKERNVIIRIFILVVVIALLYALLTEASSIGEDVSNRAVKRFISKLWQYSSMFFPLILLYRTALTATKKQKIILIIVSLIAIIPTCFTVLRAIAINPLAARNFGFEEDVALDSNWFAPYPFVYGMTFSFLLCFVLAYYYLKNLYKWIAYSFCFFFFYFLFKSQFTLALLTTLITLTIILYKNSPNSSSKTLIIIIGIFILLLLPTILGLLVSILPGMLASRIGEMHLFLGGDTNQGGDSDLLGRLELYKKAIIAFLSSPLWGNRVLDFDGHATFLMVWADLGLIGGFAVFKLLFYSRSIVIRLLGNESKMFKLFFIQLLLMGFTNPIHASLPIDIMLWFIVPLALITFQTMNISNSYEKRI